MLWYGEHHHVRRKLWTECAGFVCSTCSSSHHVCARVLMTEGVDLQLRLFFRTHCKQWDVNSLFLLFFMIFKFRSLIFVHWSPFPHLCCFLLNRTDSYSVSPLCVLSHFVFGAMFEEKNIIIALVFVVFFLIQVFLFKIADISEEFSNSVYIMQFCVLFKRYITILQYCT